MFLCKNFDTANYCFTGLLGVFGVLSIYGTIFYFVGLFDSLRSLIVILLSPESGPRPKAEDHERAPKARVEWWRCRELNPGPTCRERASTVMSLSVLPAIRKRRRTAERGDAKCLLNAHQDSVHLAGLRLIPVARIRSETCSRKRRTKRPSRTEEPDSDEPGHHLQCGWPC